MPGGMAFSSLASKHPSPISPCIHAWTRTSVRVSVLTHLPHSANSSAVMHSTPRTLGCAARSMFRVLPEGMLTFRMASISTRIVEAKQCGNAVRMAACNVSRPCPKSSSCASSAKESSAMMLVPHDCCKKTSQSFTATGYSFSTQARRSQSRQVPSQAEDFPVPTEKSCTLSAQTRLSSVAKPRLPTHATDSMSRSTRYSATVGQTSSNGHCL
mmetsp:Transcript_148528/g.259083  ORF Transcript_148528/g.259083 Transcript_148528/m.259083 type:complete len:213 (+) Transcript_148528:280-918(+)